MKFAEPTTVSPIRAVVGVSELGEQLGGMQATERSQ